MGIGIPVINRNQGQAFLFKTVAFARVKLDSINSYFENTDPDVKRFSRNRDVEVRSELEWIDLSVNATGHSELSGWATSN